MLKLFILLAIVLVQVTQSWQNLSLQLFIKHMKVASGNDKQALQELQIQTSWAMKNMEKTWQARGLWDLHHGRVHDCHQCCRSCKKKLTASLLRTPKTAEFEERHVPALHHPLHQHGQCVLMTEREPMRGPPLHCQQLCHPNNFAPSHLSLLQNMAVEMKVMS